MPTASKRLRLRGSRAVDTMRAAFCPLHPANRRPFRPPEKSMSILFGFTPFIAFMLVERLLNVTFGLSAGALVASALVIRNRRAPKILEIGTLIVFVALTIYVAVSGAKPSVIALRLCVDVGLLCVVLVSMFVRRPFTMQYAREQVPEAYWNTPQFLHVNYVITAAWACAFAVMVSAEAALIALPQLPAFLGYGVIVAALLGAALFTRAQSAHNN
jgi:hypothetical protein